MTEDERTEQTIQFYTDLALLKHHPSPKNKLSNRFCDECGNEIPLARQKALPGVTLCIECKQAEEKLQRTT